MSFLADDSPIMNKTCDLCGLITEDAEFADIQKDVEAFFADDSARENFLKIQEWGEELNQKQRAGLALDDKEVSEFEAARTGLLENPLASNFISAQQTLQTLQGMIGKYIAMTMELGRVPTKDDLAAQNSGCCGGGGGGGCGCG